MHLDRAKKKQTHTHINREDRVESGRETIIVFRRSEKKEMEIENILLNYAQYGIETYIVCILGVGTR